MTEQAEITYACAVRSGNEYTVEEELKEIASWAECVREVHAFTPPNTRRAVAAERPIWPGYIFARMDGDAFYASRTIKHLHPTKLALCTKEVSRLHAAIAAVRAKNEATIRAIDAGEMVTDLTEGDTVELLEGAFAGRLANFAQVVKRADSSYDLMLTLPDMSLPITIPAENVRRIA